MRQGNPLHPATAEAAIAATGVSRMPPPLPLLETRRRVELSRQAAAERREVPASMGKTGPSWLHSRFKVVVRGDKKSSVAGAAYNSRSVLRDERTGELHDFRHAHQHERVLADLGVSLPEGAPAAWTDRAVLWNEVERVERRADAQLCRRGDFSLPDVLDKDELIGLARSIVADRVAEGHVVDAVIHRSIDGTNCHLHIQEPLRACDANGFLPKSVNVYLVRDPSSGVERKATAEEFRILKERGYEKVYRYSRGSKRRKLTPTEAESWQGCKRLSKTPVQETRYLASDWNEPTKAREWREGVALRTNEALERHYDRENVLERERAYVDCRSYAEQGVSQLPQLHEGGAARAEEKRERKRCDQRNIAYRPVTDIALENLRRRELNEASRIAEHASESLSSVREDAERWADSWVGENVAREASRWYDAVAREREDENRFSDGVGSYSLASESAFSRAASTSLEGGSVRKRSDSILQTVVGVLQSFGRDAVALITESIEKRWPEFAEALVRALAAAPFVHSVTQPADGRLSEAESELEEAAALSGDGRGDVPRGRSRTWSATPPRLVAVGTPAYEEAKRAFIQRLEEAFARYRRFSRTHQGLPFENFPEFRGTVPAELRRDPEVRRRVSARLRDGEELRCRYASGVPIPLRPAPHASCPESSPTRGTVPIERERTRGGDAR